jgi:hypothetical protein
MSRAAMSTRALRAFAARCEAQRIPLAAESLALAEEIDPAQGAVRGLQRLSIAPQAPSHFAEWTRTVIAEAPALPERRLLAVVRAATASEIPASPLAARFDAIAAALGVGVTHHPKALAVLTRYYETRGGINPARLRMARVPDRMPDDSTRPSSAVIDSLLNSKNLSTVTPVLKVVSALTPSCPRKPLTGRPCRSWPCGRWSWLRSR